MTTYAQKSSAQRAAKKLPEGTFSIDQNESGQWEISPKGQALQKFLKEHDESKISKAKKAKEIKAEYAPKIEATMPKPVVAEKVEPSEAPAIDEPKILISDDDSSTLIPTDDQLEAALIDQGDKLADVQAVNTDPLRPRISTIPRATKKVWDIADNMPNAKRKDVIAACVQAGIAYGTARTQYQHWFKCVNDCKAAPIATIGADGKIVMPVK